MTVTAEIVISVFILLTIVSLVQVVATRRMVRRLRDWQADVGALPDVEPFANSSRALVAVWSGGVIAALAAYASAQGWARGHVGEAKIFCVVMAVWCLIQMIISRLSDVVCREAQRLAATRELTQSTPVTEAAAFPPSGMEPSEVSEEQFDRRLTTLERTVQIWFGFL